MVSYFKESLRGKGFVHAANSIDTYALHAADYSVITPLIHEGNYVDFLIEYCQRNSINAVISLFDIDLPVLSLNKYKFEKNLITVIVSEHEFVQICNDKWLTYNYLLENGFSTPATFLSVKDALSAVEKKYLNFPVIIKPRWGMGSIGIFEADNREELEILYLKTMKSINSSYLKYESNQELTKSILIQEKLVGEEYGLDVFNDLNGKLLTCIPKKKLAMRAGETDSAIIVNDIELIEIAERISKKSKHIGNLDIDCIKVDNTFYILEMNSRFGGQYPFSHLAGVNLPEVLIRLLSGEVIENDLLNAKIGTVGVKDLMPVMLNT